MGYYKKGASRQGITYPDARDEALCWGWIDGKVKSLDEERYVQRFTPRKKGSTWSQVNLGRVEELTGLGRMQPAGIKAFEARTAERTGVYSFEADLAELPVELQALFQADSLAWRHFQAQPPAYRRTCLHWVVSAKREETRRRRLQKLLEASAAKRRLDLVSPGRP